jgi:hypothetical protein
VVYTKTGEPKYIRITNISDVAQSIKRHEPVGQLVHEDHVPLKLGYVRTNSCRYQEWQTLAFERKYSRRQEAELDDEFEHWVRDNPALPNKAPMPTSPVKILKRNDSCLLPKELVPTAPVIAVAVTTKVSEDSGIQDKPDDNDLRLSEITMEEDQMAEKFVCMSAQDVHQMIEKDCDKTYTHHSAKLYAEDLAGQLAMIPELDELKQEEVDTSTIINYLFHKAEYRI